MTGEDTPSISIPDETTTPTNDVTPPPPSSSASYTSNSNSKVEAAIQSLSSILPSTPPPPTATPHALLHDATICDAISSLLRDPDSGAGDNNLCRWLYDTFQSSDQKLQLLVLRFLPLVAGLYLTRVHLHKPLAGFEAVLLALYAHETTSRAGQSVTLNITNLAHPSAYHDPKDLQSNSGRVISDSTEMNLAVLSPSLEPHGTVRSTRRARIVGVALELYYRNVAQMPAKSKIDFCEFVEIWAGQDGDVYREELPGHGGGGVGEEKRKKGRIALPWELLQPVLRVLGHCLLGPGCVQDKQLYEAACAACRSLYARALHEIDPNAVLATRSLLRLGKMAAAPAVDHTEIVFADTLTLTTS